MRGAFPAYDITDVETGESARRRRAWPNRTWEDIEAEVGDPDAWKHICYFCGAVLPDEEALAGP